MPLENRELTAGTILVARYKKEDHTCVVMETEEGLRYRVAGTDYKSPSSAAKAVMGGIAANGWRFWSLQGDLKPAREPKPKKEKVAKKEKPAKAPAKKKASKKKKAAKMETAASYGCGACSEEFATMKAATKHAMTHTAA